jgi:hypothetical protein
MISSFSEIQAQIVLPLLNIIVLECSAPQDKEGCAEAKLLGKLCTTAPIPGQVRRQKSFRAFGLVYLERLNYALLFFFTCPNQKWRRMFFSWCFRINDTFILPRPTQPLSKIDKTPSKPLTSAPAPSPTILIADNYHFQIILLI